MSPRLRRLLRISLRVVLGLLGLVGLVLLVFVTLAPVRSAVLRVAIDKASDTLPGTLTVDDAGWPSLARIDLNDVLWTDAGDTLLSAERLFVDARIRPLLSKDLVVNSIEALAVQANLPALQARFPAPAVDSTVVQEPASPGGVPYLRTGSLPGVPSVAINAIRITASRVVLPDSTTVRDVSLDLGAQLLAEAPARLSVNDLRAHSPEQGWRLGSGSLVAEPRDKRVHGGLAISVQGQPVFVRLSTPADRILVAVTPDSAQTVPDIWGMELSLALVFDGEVPIGADYELTLVTPSTPELDALSLPGVAVEGLPDLDRLRIEASGKVHWDPTVRATANVHLRGNSWMEPGFLRATWDSGRLDCDSLDVGLPGLRVTGTASMADTLLAQARVRIRGTQWLTLLQPDTAPPDSLVADLRASVSGAVASPRVTLRLDGGVRSGSTTIAPLTLDASMAPDRSGTFRLRARTFDLWAGLEGGFTLGDRIIADLSPLRIVDALATNKLPEGGKRSRVTFDPTTRDLEVKDLRMTGELGELLLAASLEDFVNGSASLDWTLNRAPAPLIRLLDDRPAERDALASAWQKEEPVFFDLDFTSARRDSALTATATGSFRLPGPRRLRALLPENASVDDLGPLAGSLRIGVSPSKDGPAFAADVDLSATEWIDAARVVAHGTAQEIAVDSLSLALDGVRAWIAGTVGEILDLTGFVQVDSLALARRILGMERDDLEARLSLQGDVQGTRAKPKAHVLLEGSADYAEHSVPSLRAEVRLDEGRLDASLDAQADLADGALRIDTAQLRVTSLADTLFPARIDLTVEGPELGLRQTVEVSRDDGWFASFDTLAVRLRKADFSNQGPFTIAVNAEADSLHIDGLNLTGSLGRILVDGGAGAHGADLIAQVEMALAETPPPGITLPEGLEGVWPDSIRFNVRAEGTSDVRSDLWVNGIDYAGKQGLSLVMDLHGNSERVLTNVRFGDATEQLIEGTFEGPGTVSVYPPSLAMVDGALKGNLQLNRLPLPLSPRNPDLFAMGDGELTIGGAPDAPSLGLDLGLTFPQWKKLAEHRFELDMQYGQDGADSMLVVGMDLRKGSQSLLTGRTEVPLRVSLLPTLVEASATRPMSAKITSEWIALADFDELLPSDVAVAGELKLELAAEGGRESLGFDGNLTLRDVEARLAGAARGVVAGRLDLGGTLERPSVRGELELKNGIIQIPEQKRTLLPYSGTAELWQQTAWAAETDSVLLVRDTLTVSREPLDLDLDIRIVIPGNLWIRGRDMELELEGDLKVAQAGAQPTVTGKLKARRGDLRFVGRQFQVDRGDVFFYGGDEINPSLDLRLKSEIDNLTFWVAVTGTALEPKLKLSSEPEALSEGDIMCYLVFGQRCDELDSGQGDLVGRMAAGYASAELTQALSGELGVDMVSINVGDSQSSASVTVGKYLSTKLLLKYEQALDNTRDFFLNLEYSLTRNIKFTTLAGSRQSGAEIRWSVEY